MGRLQRLRSGTRAVVAEMRREDVTFMAASIAYHAFVSMLPVLFLLVLVVSTFGSDEVVATVLGLTSSFLPSPGRGVIIDAMRNATEDVGLSVVGVGVLLWGTSKVFRAMDAAFAEIYDTQRNASLLAQLRDAAVVFLSMGTIAVGAVALDAVVRVPAYLPFPELLGDLVGFVGLAVAFFPMYYVFPDTAVSARGAIPGVLVAAVGWLGLEWLFNLYVALTNKPDLFGLVGTLLLLVTWLYAGSLVLLAGASVNATLAGRDGARRSARRTKRQFGNRMTDADSFERRIDGLLARADDADVSTEELRRILAERADELADEARTTGGARINSDRSASSGDWDVGGPSRADSGPDKTDRENSDAQSNPD